MFVLDCVSISMLIVPTPQPQLNKKEIKKKLEMSWELLTRFWLFLDLFVKIRGNDRGPTWLLTGWIIFLWLSADKIFGTEIQFSSNHNAIQQCRVGETFYQIIVIPWKHIVSPSQWRQVEASLETREVKQLSRIDIFFKDKQVRRRRRRRVLGSFCWKYF